MEITVSPDQYLQLKALDSECLLVDGTFDEERWVEGVCTVLSVSMEELRPLIGTGPYALVVDWHS